MALKFIAIDPDTDREHCPAVFVEEETGDLLFQGETVTHPETLAESVQHSPLAHNEGLVRLPARMRKIIMEALHDAAAVQRTDSGDDTISSAPGDAGRVHPSDPEFQAWKQGKPRTPPDTPDWWHNLVREHAARGIRFRRARIVSEPVSDYIRFEHEATGWLNVAAGEEVRWLPRRRASDLCLPGNDFWLFDDRLIRFHHFSGDGEIVEDELCDDPTVIARCMTAFEAVWDRAVPHADYRLG